MTKLLVRPVLTNLREAELPENADNFPRLRTGSFGTSTYFNELGAHELGLDLRFAIFEEQREDFT
jgi:hypothetical protein